MSYKNLQYVRPTVRFVSNEILCSSVPEGAGVHMVKLIRDQSLHLPATFYLSSLARLTAAGGLAYSTVISISYETSGYQSSTGAGCMM